MSQGANVDDLDVFRYMKTAMIKFKQSVETALINADAQNSRLLHWLEGEQLSHWQTQIRKRQEHITRCKEAVRAKKLFKDSTGRTPSAFQEEKNLRAAVLALEEAEIKLAHTRRAIPAVQKEIENYRSGIQPLGSALVSEVPKAIALLERLSTTLHDYTSLAAQTPVAGDTAAAPTSPPAGGMHRGGETADQSQPSHQPEDKPDVTR